MAELPASLRRFKGVLLQAKQVEKVNAKAAYYARLYVVQAIMALPGDARDAATTAFVGDMLDRLEKDSAEMHLDKAADRFEMEAFAMNVLRVARTADADAKWDAGVVRAYLTASVFLDVLAYFDGAIDDDVNQRVKFARWRATEISKALKEGRQPTPLPEADADDDGGGLQDDVELEIGGGGRSSSFDEDEAMPKAPAYSSSADEEVPSKAPAPAPTAPPVAASSINAANASKFALMNEAEKSTKEAMAALRFNDLDAAEVRLSKALHNVKLLRTQ